ncbi:MAG: Fic family protein [Bryobacterales bacterium]|nr:Fic family protein [Bryobacterales bacterium]
MAYRHVQGLDSAAISLADSEIPALVRVIADYRQYLPGEKWRAFQTRVAREWAIETGQIEGLYRFDRGLTMTLIEAGITASRIPGTASAMSPEQVAAILHDHLATLEGLFTFVKGDRPLSKGYIHELHQALLRNQHTHPVLAAATGAFFDKPLTRGKYKEQPNNPLRPDGTTFEYCPPVEVDAEMERLIDLYHAHESQGVPAELQAAWLHHAFTCIHPYADGNGRVARALATLVLIKAGLMPLVVPAEEKQSIYIPALEAADAGDYRALVESIRRWQGRLVIELSQRVTFEEAKPAGSLEEFFAAVEKDMVRQGLRPPQAWESAAEIAQEAFHHGYEQLRVASERLMKNTQASGLKFLIGESRALPPDCDLGNRGYPAFDVKTCVLQLGYRNSPKESAQAQIQLIRARAGAAARGLELAVAWYLSERESGPLGHPFLISFGESKAHALERFSRWMNTQLLEGLEKWRQTYLAETREP